MNLRHTHTRTMNTAGTTVGTGTNMDITEMVMDKEMMMLGLALVDSEADWVNMSDVEKLKLLMKSVKQPKEKFNKSVMDLADSIIHLAEDQGHSKEKTEGVAEALMFQAQELLQRFHEGSGEHFFCRIFRNFRRRMGHIFYMTINSVRKDMQHNMSLDALYETAAALLDDRVHQKALLRSDDFFTPKDVMLISHRIRAFMPYLSTSEPSLMPSDATWTNFLQEIPRLLAQVLFAEDGVAKVHSMLHGESGEEKITDPKMLEVQKRAISLCCEATMVPLCFPISCSEELLQLFNKRRLLEKVDLAFSLYVMDKLKKTSRDSGSGDGSGDGV